MMNKININSTLVILITTLLFLFVGHYIYQSQYMEKPIGIALQSIPHAKLKHVVIQPKNVRIVISTEPGFSLKEYPLLRDRIQEIVCNRRMELRVLDRPNVTLEETWQKMVFGVWEGIAHNTYTTVRESVTAVAKENNIESVVLMDDNYLYIELRQQKNYLLRVLPLDKINNNVKNSD